MWQHHYVIHAMRMEALRAEAERERRWRLADRENRRPGHSSAPGPVRGTAARFAAAVARYANRAAHRLDGRIAVDLGAERAAHEA
jgi:hypothetical protein